MKRILLGCALLLAAGVVACMAMTRDEVPCANSDDCIELACGDSDGCIETEPCDGEGCSSIG